MFAPSRASGFLYGRVACHARLHSLDIGSCCRRMASTLILCEMQAICVASSHALIHLHALCARLSIAARALPLDCSDLFLICQNVKTTSLPTAVSYVLYEPMSFRFNNDGPRKESGREKKFLVLVQTQNHLCALLSICTKPRKLLSCPDFFRGPKQVESTMSLGE